MDVSGSVDIATINTLFKEVEATIWQFDCIEIKVSYFDHMVSDPIVYTDIKDFDTLQVGEGGAPWPEEGLL